MEHHDAEGDYHKLVEVGEDHERRRGHVSLPGAGAGMGAAGWDRRCRNGGTGTGTGTGITGGAGCTAARTGGVSPRVLLPRPFRGVRHTRAPRARTCALIPAYEMPTALTQLTRSIIRSALVSCLMRAHLWCSPK